MNGAYGLLRPVSTSSTSETPGMSSRKMSSLSSSRVLSGWVGPHIPYGSKTEDVIGTQVGGVQGCTDFNGASRWSRAKAYTAHVARPGRDMHKVHASHQGHDDIVIGM